MLNVVFSNSPFLTRCLVAELELFADIVADGPDRVLGQLLEGLKTDRLAQRERDDLKARLRRARRQAALVIALADITGRWSLDQVTEGLSALADGALACAVANLLLGAHGRGELVLPDPARARAGLRLRGAGDGQVRRAGAELFLGHRSHRVCSIRTRSTTGAAAARTRPSCA